MLVQILTVVAAVSGVVGIVACAITVALGVSRRRHPVPHVPAGRAQVAYAQGRATPAEAAEVVQVLRRGVWCDRCMLSTAMEVDVTRDGLVVTTLRGCERCRSGICETPSA